MTLSKFRIHDISLKLFLMFVIVCPIFFYAPKNFGWQTLRIGQEQFLQLGTTALVAIFIIENIYLAMILLAACLSYCLGNFPPNAGQIVLNLMFGCLLYQITYRLMNRTVLRYISDIMLWLLTANLIFMCLQGLGLGILYLSHSSSEYTDQFVGIMGLKSINGMFMALCLPFIASRNLLTATLLLGPIALSSSASAFVCACIILSIYIFQMLKVRKIVSILAITILLISGLIYSNRDAKYEFWADKISVWKVTLRDAVKKPIFGWGLDSFRSISSDKPFVYFKNTQTNETVKFRFHKETNSLVPPKELVGKNVIVDPWDHPHNEFVMIFYEFGVIGIVLLTLFLRDIHRRYRDCSYRAIKDEIKPIYFYMIGILILSIGQFPLHLSRIVYMIPILLAGLYKLTENNEF